MLKVRRCGSFERFFTTRKNAGRAKKKYIFKSNTFFARLTIFNLILHSTLSPVKLPVVVYGYLFIPILYY